MVNPTYLGGKVDVSLNGVTIPAKYLSDDGVVTTLTEATREIPTLAGTFTQNTGTFEEATIVFTVTLPNLNYLKNIFPDMYTASSDRPLVAGQVKFGGNTCTERANTPVVAHYSCQTNSDNDVYVPNASVVANVEMTQNVSDPVTVQVTANAQPDETTGVIAILGTGDLTKPTLWSASTATYVSV